MSPGSLLIMGKLLFRSAFAPVEIVRSQFLSLRLCRITVYKFCNFRRNHISGSFHRIGGKVEVAVVVRGAQAADARGAKKKSKALIAFTLPGLRCAYLGRSAMLTHY